MRLAVVIAALFLAGALWVRHLERTRPWDLPWTPLSLAHPIGAFTRTKLVRLDPAACQALLSQAGVAFTPVPDRVTAPGCGFTGAVRLTGPELSPRGVTLTCPAAAALTLWRTQVLAPAARLHLDADPPTLTHFGSYSCRRLYGRSTGDFSQHATANAIDISGFRTSAADPRVVRDWTRTTPSAAFLQDARDGACRVFGTTLSPDYNAAHADHLHLDMASRGPVGFCR